MKTYYISSTEQKHIDFDVRFYDLDKAMEYARWRKYDKIEEYQYQIITTMRSYHLGKATVIDDREYYEASFIDLETAIEYALWRGHVLIKVYDDGKYAHTIKLENINN